MVDDLATLVGCESPADDPPAMAACGELVADLGSDLFGLTAERIDAGGSQQLIWRGGGPTSVLLVGHFGAVRPGGAVAGRPFSVDGDRATGAGVLDKAGLVQMLYALSVLDDLTAVTMIVLPTLTLSRVDTRGALQPEARGARAVLIGDPGESVTAHGAATQVFELARALARRIGLPELRLASARPGSPLLIPADLGPPTLAGLGADGARDAHGEWASVGAMSNRSALLAALIASVRTDGFVAADQGPGETSAGSTM